ncbi:MAG: HAD family hydrolase [Spirochaetaceae bacterium]|jgi:putative hydrolase of the HAD superfamily|nr:HAD family hydrolase [Spirochaetaceae bacterium]
MTGVRALIFDLFFTLIDPLDLAPGQESEYSVLGMDRRDFEGRNAVDYAVRGCGEIRDPCEMMRHILRGLDVPEALLRRAAEARVERIRRAIYGAAPKNIAFLQRLRDAGFSIALISNADAADLYHWKGSALSRSFDAAIFSYDVGLLKPDPRIFRMALERLGVRGDQCLYVGDGGHDELRGAKDAGMTTVLTTEYIRRAWPERINALRQDADHVVEGLEEVWDLAGS